MSALSSGTEALTSPLHAEIVHGVAYEVKDLAETQAFYEPIFFHSGGDWRRDSDGLTYRCEAQTIQFVERPQPRTFPDSGYHWAYRVPIKERDRIVHGLADAGGTVHWWREDHPLERDVSAYLHDPSGNIVQLVPSDDNSILLDHAGIEIHMFDYCEYLYVAALGGHVDYYHGWRTVDLEEAKKWAGGDDPCAPWTRRDNPTYRDFLVEDPKTGEMRPSRFSVDAGGDRRPRQLRVPRPNGQVFVGYGATRLVLISATATRQEAPEEQVQGTPRVVLSTSCHASDIEAWLQRFPIPRLRDGRDFFLRDADGNFCQLSCRG